MCLTVYLNMYFLQTLVLYSFTVCLRSWPSLFELFVVWALNAIRWIVKGRCRTFHSLRRRSVTRRRSCYPWWRILVYRFGFGCELSLWGASDETIYLLSYVLNFSCNSVQVQKVLFPAVFSVYNWKGLTRKLIKSFLKRGFTVNKFF